MTLVYRVIWGKSRHKDFNNEEDAKNYAKIKYGYVKIFQKGHYNKPEKRILGKRN